MNSGRDQRFVIFGCGYVGGEMARQALARGLRVTALTRNHAHADKLRDAGVEIVMADLASETWHSEIAGGAEFVLNTVSSGGGGVEGYRRSYVDGMRSILKWAQRRGTVGTLVYTSSTSVYPQDQGVFVDESASTEASDERAQLLLEAERILRQPDRCQAGTTAVPVEKSGRTDGADAFPYRRYFILRLAGIYGPQRHHLLEQVRRGEVSGSGKHRLNLIHRDDVCAAIFAVLNAPPAVANEIFNVADDFPTAKQTIVAWLAAQIGVPVPAFTGAPAAGRRASTPDRVIVSGKLKSTLGWHPRFRSFREGYADILAKL